MYGVTTDEQSQPQIDALPSVALAGTCAVLKVAPWGGDSVNDGNPDAPVRSRTFGPNHQGMVTYLIVESQRRVDILDVLWLS